MPIRRAQTVSVYFREELEADSGPIPVRRTRKYTTLVGCICADGGFVNPLSSIPRHSIYSDLKLFGILEAKGVRQMD
jgi:hypothetical protein